MHAGRIGSAELAEQTARRAEVDLRLGLSSMDRLAAIVAKVPPPAGVTNPAETEGAIEAKLRFQPGPEGHPQVRLHIRGELLLVCQRCLGPMRWPVALDEVLTVVGSEADGQRLADPFDTALMPAEGLSLAALVEDEVLASLPLAPMHARGTGEGRCQVSADVEAESELTHRPFADLKSRLGGGADRSDE